MKFGDRNFGTTHTALVQRRPAQAKWQTIGWRPGHCHARVLVGYSSLDAFHIHLPTFHLAHHCYCAWDVKPKQATNSSEKLVASLAEKHGFSLAN